MRRLFKADRRQESPPTMINQCTMINQWLFMAGAVMIFLNLLTCDARGAKRRTAPHKIDVLAKIDADFKVQGEYTGQLKTKDEPSEKFGVQIVALKSGQFRALGYHGGLPGDGWDKSKKIIADGQRKDDLVKFDQFFGGAQIKDGVLTIKNTGGVTMGQLKHVVRKSPTLGKKPPKDAIVLYDGTIDQFSKGFRTEEGYKMGAANCNVVLKKDFHLHVEFRVPYRLPNNSGIKGIKGFYEIQVLDSFGKQPGKHDCGALYGIRVPDVNMSFPPLSWQTYDVDYFAAQYDSKGKETKRPMITVRHNGVITHDKFQAPGNRRGGPVRLHLQSHGGIIHYRNIWAVIKNDRETK